MEWIIDGLALAVLFLPFAFLFPTCICCGSCDYFTDDFAADNLATDWDDRAGTWSVASGLLATTSANAKIVTVAEADAGATGIYAEVLVRCATTSDIGELIVAYVDDDNYWFADLKPGGFNGTLRLFQRSGGVNTQRGPSATISSLNANDLAIVSICIESGSIAATAVVGTAFGSNSAGTSYAASISVANTQAGVGSGSGSSDVEFDNFLFGKHITDDASCYRCAHTCSRCTDSDDLAPNAVQIVGTGFADAGINCDEMNATFILPADPGLSCAGYQDGNLPPYTDLNCVNMNFYLNGVQGFVFNATGCSVFPFVALTGSPDNGAASTDCLNWNGEPITFSGAPSGGCASAGGSFSVTAL